MGGRVSSVVFQFLGRNKVQCCAVEAAEQNKIRSRRAELNLVEAAVEAAEAAVEVLDASSRIKFFFQHWAGV